MADCRSIRKYFGEGENTIFRGGVVGGKGRSRGLPSVFSLQKCDGITVHATDMYRGSRGIDPLIHILDSRSHLGLLTATNKVLVLK